MSENVEVSRTPNYNHWPENALYLAILCIEGSLLYTMCKSSQSSIIIYYYDLLALYKTLNYSTTYILSAPHSMFFHQPILHVST